MIITKKSLSRRTVLRGLGVALGLPLLDSMVPALSAMTQTAAKPVPRFGAVYVPNGMAMQYWTPAAEGRTFEMTPILKPLAPFQNQLVVVSGLNGPRGGDHIAASTGFLTATAGSQSSKTRNVAGTSADQFAAREFAKHTQFASLELGLDRDASGSCDGNFSCTLVNTVSWLDEMTPLPVQIDPGALFERLFGDGGTTDPRARAARFARDRSILDSIVGRVADLERRVGPSDRMKLGQYLDSVRDVERRIQKAAEQNSESIPAMSQPPGIPASYDEHAKLMFDLQVLAYQSDLTRVITFMFGHELTARNYPQIGVPDGHHPLSHHGYDPALIAKLSKINTYHVSLLAYYLEKLRATPDGDGSLLDHIIMLYGGGISDSHAHSHDNVPIILVGAGSGQLQGGRHLKFPAQPLGNLLLSILDKLGVPIDHIGEGKEKLAVDNLPSV